MKSFPLVLIAFAWSLWHAAHGAAQAPADSGALDAVLKKMDATAASFRATQADFEWDRYEKVINEVDDVQSGTIYYRRAGKDKDIEMMADIKQEGGSVAELKPAAKSVLFREGKVSVYSPSPTRSQFMTPARTAPRSRIIWCSALAGAGRI